MIDTKQRILETAERLFSEHGYAATSLRRLIGEASVNLAAVHYHFGSKENLLDQVVTRRLGPLNQERLALLVQYESEAAPDPVPLEKVLEALLMPALSKARQSPHFVKLMGRLHVEDIMPAILEKHFKPMTMCFFTALSRALPNLSNEELLWRVHFMVGAMAHTLFGPPHAFEGAVEEPPARVAKRLIAFLSAGFRAPTVQAEQVEVK